MRAFGAFAMLLLSSLPGPSYANGALAIDSNKGPSYGFSYGYASQGAANRRAVSECGAPGCHVVVKFAHACAAYAADQASGSTAYGWGWQSPGIAGSSGEVRAKRRAMSECASRGGKNSSCVIRVWGCDP